MVAWTVATAPAGPALRLAAVAAFATVLVSGCLWPGSGPGPYVPEVAGIVTARESPGGGLTRYVLANGQTFTLNDADARTCDRVYGAGPYVGDLMLAGRNGGRPWLALMPPGEQMRTDLPVGCYELASRGADKGDSIQTDVGLVLTKAWGFTTAFYPLTPGMPAPTAYPGMRYEGSPQAFCLNAEGLVTAAR